MLVFLEGVSLVFRCIILTWGTIVLIHNFIIKRKIVKIQYWKILILFLFSCLVTTFLHMGDNFLPNLLAVYHTAICFFIFYGMSAETSKEKIEKEMSVISKAIVVMTTVLNILGLLIFVVKVQLNIGEYWLGIFNNRFIGLYTNSNLLALSSVLAIIGCHLLISDKIPGEEKKTGKKKALYVTAVFFNFAALILSDSNASFLFLIIYITVVLFYHLFSQRNKIPVKEIFKKSCILLLCCLTLTILSFELRGICQDGIASLINDVHRSEEPIHDNRPAPEAVEIGREHYDVSSGRITLLKQAMQMYRYHPIMGVGRGNIVEYGERLIPGGLIFSDFHNGYVTILVSWGMVGFFIFIALSILVAIDMCRSLFQKDFKEDSGIFPCLFAMVVAYCIYSLFEKTILSEITFMVVMFWLILGYSMTYVKEKGNKI